MKTLCYARAEQGVDLEMFELHQFICLYILSNPWKVFGPKSENHPPMVHRESRGCVCVCVRERERFPSMCVKLMLWLA
jgi:hypothetical protein